MTATLRRNTPLHAATSLPDIRCAAKTNSSVDAELVALGVLHHDEPRAGEPIGFEPLDPGCPETGQPLTLGFERRHPLFPLQTRGGADVEVHAVLHRLGLRHALEEDARPSTVRVHHCRACVALVLRHLPGVEGLVSGAEGRRRWLYDAAERCSPKLSLGRGIDTVERDMNRSGHHCTGPGSAPGYSAASLSSSDRLPVIGHPPPPSAAAPSSAPGSRHGAVRRARTAARRRLRASGR